MTKCKINSHETTYYRGGLDEPAFLIVIRTTWLDKGLDKGALSKMFYLLRFPTEISSGQIDQEFFSDHFYTPAEALGWSA